MTVDNVTIHQQMQHVQSSLAQKDKDGSEEVAASPRDSDELSVADIEQPPPESQKKHRFSIKNVEVHNQITFNGDASPSPVKAKDGADSDAADGNTGSHKSQLSEMDITDDLLQNRSRAKSLYHNRDDDTRNLTHVRERPGAPCHSPGGTALTLYLISTT